jgi:hypothetical protein
MASVKNISKPLMLVKRENNLVLPPGLQTAFNDQQHLSAQPTAKILTLHSVHWQCNLAPSLWNHLHTLLAILA